MMRFVLAAVAAASLGAPVAASATIVNIDASKSGCDFVHCSGEHVGPGTVLNAVFSPSQLTLAAGTYTVTNGSGKTGANPNDTAWNYNSGGNNWLWAFMAIADDSYTVLLDSVPDPGISVVSTQAAAAAQPAATNYMGSFTLSHATTVDFVTEDYYAPDNLGGVSLSVVSATPGVPEPASWAMMLVGLGLGGAAIRSSRKRLVPA